MKIVNLLCIAILYSVGSCLFAQSGGDFVITQSVLAGGGSTSADVGNVFTITGTVGQANAGDNSTGTPFNVKTGFWTAVFPPTAAGALISGRVTRGKDLGIKGAILTLEGGTMTSPRIARTNNFGYFRFEDVETGHSYVLTVTHKRYFFAEPNRFFTLMEDLTGLEFVATW